MAGDDLIELKFRLFDGTDIGPNNYDPSTTVGYLKEIILNRWPEDQFFPVCGSLRCAVQKREKCVAPEDKEIAPKSINDVKLINGGKILENNCTIAESRVPVGELPGGVITMHVVVRPPVPDKNNEKQLANNPKQHRCACTIL